MPISTTFEDSLCSALLKLHTATAPNSLRYITMYQLEFHLSVS